MLFHLLSSIEIRKLDVKVEKYDPNVLSLDFFIQRIRAKIFKIVNMSRNFIFICMFTILIEGSNAGNDYIF